MFLEAETCKELFKILNVFPCIYVIFTFFCCFWSIIRYSIR